MFFHQLWHALLHAIEHTWPLIPFLYLTYLVMELLERRAGERVEQAVSRAGRAGPAIGALLGALPQCGFSAAGAGLYAGRVITTGTLLAIFWSTSDEMLPLLLSSGTRPGIILKILACKMVIAALFGFAVDAIARLTSKKETHEHHIGELCRSGHCHCDDRPLWSAALFHTLQITLSVLIVSFALNLALELLGEDFLVSILRSIPWLGTLLSALVGLIPNCASSIAITQLYLSGVLSAGSLLSGLLVGAGVGLLVLIRTNRPLKDTLRVVAILFCVGVVTGLLFDALSLGALLGI
ncbi:MAG: hypothetical protein E7625_07055 [Ruminococcaceae bacterium]|nr:hypothetical protein [Oscillospiraceae bacterium]